MGVVETLSLAMGTAWTSGLNLYATIAALGLAGRYELIHLPPGLEILMHPLVIGAACLMYVLEFVVDKVPFVDSAWDVLHTFIRIPAGALLAAQTVGDVSPALELAAYLAGGGIAATAHSTKMLTRVAINTSPEPFSNWTASVTEDATVFGGLWVIYHYPLLAIISVVIFVAIAIWLLPKLYRTGKAVLLTLWTTVRGLLRRRQSDIAAETQTVNPPV
ncbi:MAG: DUF4126 domain-containing protein [Candidatus Binatia bacterium]